VTHPDQDNHDFEEYMLDRFPPTSRMEGLAEYQVRYIQELEAKLLTEKKRVSLLRKIIRILREAQP
jgi:hypothetical protein